jgi:hypothetical protein
VRCPSCGKVWPRRRDPARTVRRFWTRLVPAVWRMVLSAAVLTFSVLTILSFSSDANFEFISIGFDPMRVLSPWSWGSWFSGLDWEHINTWALRDGWRIAIMCFCLQLFLGLFVRITFAHWGRWLWPGMLALLLLGAAVPVLLYNLQLLVGLSQAGTQDASLTGYLRVAVVLTGMTILMPIGGLIGRGLLRGVRIRRSRRFIKFRRRLTESRPLRRTYQKPKPQGTIA